MKAYTKLTVVKFFQIFAWKSVSGSGILKIFFNKITITPVPRTRPDLRECVTSMNFQWLLVIFLSGLAGGGGGGVHN